MTDDDPDPWTRTLREMKALSAELSEDGWDTLASPAGDTAAIPPDDDRRLDPGFAHVVPDDDADTFVEWFDPDGFERTRVFRAATPDRLFLLTVMMDEPSARAILIAGAIDRSSLPPVRATAEETGVTRSHVLRVDGTHLGSFRHADPDPFFPE
ncbi:hypothetical protein ABNG03_08425 [Halorubrum sp. RMP-47]|uniref:Uncharacterized protein n=1 Tax=Halorubrum miltondacostae TaxID=3076378 RepID=A0ABD5M2A2_9EURY